MANYKGKYRTAYERMYGSVDKKEKTQLEKNQNLINDYNARLAASGVDPSKATDTRNWLEKSLNLTPNQNALFDVFELLNRPQQALFGGIENLQNGEDFLEGAKQGITGNKDTSFKDILMNTGAFDDTTFQDASKETDSKLGALLKSIDLVDVLGTSGDVFLDPMDVPFIPVSAASKGAKAIDATKFISPSQGVGKLAKGAIKGGAKLADTNLEKVLTKLDEVKGIKYTDPGSKWATELGKMGEGSGLLETYKGLKNNITTMFDTKLSKKARQTQKFNDAKEAFTRSYLENNYSTIQDTFKQAGEKLGKTVEEVDRDVNKIIDTVNEII